MKIAPAMVASLLAVVVAAQDNPPSLLRIAAGLGIRQLGSSGSDAMFLYRFTRAGQRRDVRRRGLRVSGGQVRVNSWGLQPCGSR